MDEFLMNILKKFRQKITWKSQCIFGFKMTFLFRTLSDCLFEFEMNQSLSLSFRLSAFQLVSADSINLVARPLLDQLKAEEIVMEHQLERLELKKKNLQNQIRILAETNVEAEEVEDGESSIKKEKNPEAENSIKVEKNIKTEHNIEAEEDVEVEEVEEEEVVIAVKRTRTRSKAVISGMTD